jgi:hypothetical protein
VWDQDGFDDASTDISSMPSTPLNSLPEDLPRQLPLPPPPQQDAPAKGSDEEFEMLLAKVGYHRRRCRSVQDVNCSGAGPIGTP